MRNIKGLTSYSENEYRIDLRGSEGKITAVRILMRQPGGQWEPCGDSFTKEHCAHIQQFAKVLGAVAKNAVPPFDIDGIIREAGSSPHKAAKKGKRRTSTEAKAGNGSSEEADWK